MTRKFLTIAATFTRLTAAPPRAHKPRFPGQLGCPVPAPSAGAPPLREGSRSGAFWHWSTRTVFEALSGKLSGVFDRLRSRGALNEADVTEALREVRLALLDADVALPVVRDFVGQGARARARAPRCWTASRPASRSSRSSTT